MWRIVFKVVITSVVLSMGDVILTDVLALFSLPSDFAVIVGIVLFIMGSFGVGLSLVTLWRSECVKLLSLFR